MAISAGLVGVAGALHVAHAGAIVGFVACALALAGVAHVIGEATDQIGNHLSPSVTGLVQSAVALAPVCPVSRAGGTQTPCVAGT